MIGCASSVAVSSAVKVLLLAGATIMAYAALGPQFIIPQLGLVMGLQNAIARKLAVQDLTTSVLTMTLTGIAADSTFAGGDNAGLVRRVSAVIAMFTGALAGAVVVLNAGVAFALLIATITTTGASLSAYLLGRRNGHRVHLRSAKRQFGG